MSKLAGSRLLLLVFRTFDSPASLFSSNPVVGSSFSLFVTIDGTCAMDFRERERALGPFGLCVVDIFTAADLLFTSFIDFSKNLNVD